MKFLTREEVLDRVAAGSHMEDIYVLMNQSGLDKKNKIIKFSQLPNEPIDILCKDKRVFIDFYEEPIEELPVPPEHGKWYLINDGIYPDVSSLVWVRYVIENEDGSGIFYEKQAVYDGEWFREPINQEEIITGVVYWSPLIL